MKKVLIILLVLMLCLLVACEGPGVFNQRKVEEQINESMNDGSISQEEKDIINSVDIESTAKAINGEDYVEDESWMDEDFNVDDLGIDYDTLLNPEASADDMVDAIVGSTLENEGLETSEVMGHIEE